MVATRAALGQYALLSQLATTHRYRRSDGVIVVDSFHAPRPLGQGDAYDLIDDDAAVLVAEPIDYVGGPQGNANQIARLDAKIAELRGKYEYARNDNQRRRIAKDISRLERKKAEAQGALGRALATRGGMSDAKRAQLAQAGGLAMLPRTNAGQILPSGAVAQRGRVVTDYGDEDGDGMVYTNFVEQPPPAGQGVRLPLLVSGTDVAVFTFAPGAGSRTAPVAAASGQITYADFRVYGIETQLQLQPTSEGLVSVTISNFSVNGDKNLLYAAQSSTFAGQGTGNGGKETIAALRENPILDLNNTLSLAGAIRQDATNAAAINGTVRFAAVLHTVRDRQIGGGAL